MEETEKRYVRQRLLKFIKSKVRTAPAFDHTNLLTIKVPNDMVMKARFYKKEA